VVIIAKGRVAAEGTPDEIRAQMTGGAAREATLVVRGDEAVARAAILGVSGVKLQHEAVRLEGHGGHDGVSRFVLTLEDGQDQAGDTTEALVAACVAARLGVRGLEVRTKSLEAIFHELTTAEPSADAAPRAGTEGGAA
jgi:ABC-type multidrug transport system ATPase subunit